MWLGQRLGMSYYVARLGLMEVIPGLGWMSYSVARPGLREVNLWLGWGLG